MITEEVLSRIQEYFCAGGLFNPEMMDHNKVRDLLLDCRTCIESHHDTIKWIASQSDLFFAECSQAEEIVARCQALLKGDFPTYEDRSIFRERDELKDALALLFRFTKDLCDDIGVSKHYPSLEAAAYALKICLECGCAHGKTHAPECSLKMRKQP